MGFWDIFKDVVPEVFHPTDLNQGEDQALAEAHNQELQHRVDQLESGLCTNYDTHDTNE